MQRVLSTVVLLGLLLATAAAFAITEHLKLIKSPIYATHVTKVFSPVCHCATAEAEITFSLRNSDSITATIVDSYGHEVATLATDQSEQRGAVTFHWDGRTDAGAVAPDVSSYQPQIELANARRTILMPNKIAIDTTAPDVVSASGGEGLLIAGGDHGIRIEYVFSGRAHAAVYVGSRRVILGRPTQLRDHVNWKGTAGGKTRPPGRYVLEVAAVDPAGNETPPAERKRVVVTIRYIALDETSIRVAAGAHFTIGVRTRAPQYRWRFAGAHGTGKTKLLHLRAPSRRGRYRLFVSERGYSTSARVIVRKK